MKKIAIVLSGSGHLDGTEITEAVSLLIAIDQYGAQPFCFAPNLDAEVMNHLDKKPSGEKRNVLTESARIARGHVADLATLNVKDFDAIAFPGGFGAAKVLSNWASTGAQAQVLPDVARLIKEFHSASKPIAAMCIAPTLIAKILGKEKPTLTIGDDMETASEIEKTGSHHEICPVNDYVTDRETKVITTPAYMYDSATPAEVFRGISGLVKELVEMA